MRKTLLASVAALWLFTGASGCSIGGVDVGALIQNVQALAVQGCAYVPEAAVIIAIYNTDTAQGFEAIASAICAAIGKPGARASGPSPAVKGVVLKGYYVSSI